MLTMLFDCSILLTAFLYIVLHGFCLSRIFANRRYIFASSYTLGMGYIAILLLLSSWLSWQWQYIFYIYFGTSLFVILLVCFWLLLHNNSRPQWRLSAHAVFAFVCVVFLYSVYYLWTGMYDLVPSDALRHLERIQEAYRHLTLDAAPRSYYIDSVNDRYIYYLYAILWRMTGGDVLDFMHSISWFSAIFFMSALYWFIYYAAREHTRYVVLLSVLTCLLFILHQGFAGFAYLRYYALSATLWMMPVFFLAVLLIRDLFQYHVSNRHILMISLCLIITALYHLQETLFITIMAMALLLYYFFIQLLDNKTYKHCQSRFLSLSLLLMLVFAGILFLGFYFGYIQTVSKTPVDNFKVIDLADFIGFSDNLYIINPFFQFNQVATHFGVIVYLIGICFFMLYLRIPILAAGLLVPLLTVFNPIFIDVFIRFRDVHVVYRFLYITPFAFAAAFFMTHAYESFHKDTSIMKLIRLVCIILILIMLLPFNNIKSELRYSRLPDLNPLAQNQSLRHINDAIDYLNSIEKQSYLLTDPVTGYMLTATTTHISPRYKFLPSRENFVAKQEINHQDFRFYRNWLLVVNLRDGGISKTGVLSTHWPEDVLFTSQYYSKALLNYVDSQPSNLQLLWQQNDIRIFRIK